MGGEHAGSLHTHFSDADDASRFADANIELTVGFAAPPAEPLHFAPFLAG
jgi:hypothetical protein